MFNLQYLRQVINKKQLLIAQKLSFNPLSY